MLTISSRDLSEGFDHYCRLAEREPVMIADRDKEALRLVRLDRIAPGAREPAHGAARPDPEHDP